MSNTPNFDIPKKYTDEELNTMAALVKTFTAMRGVNAEIIARDWDAEYNRRLSNGEAECGKCEKWGNALDMEYDDDTGFHICCEGKFTCKCCGDKDIDNIDGVDCPVCDKPVCDECMNADENDGNCKTDRCIKCDE